MSISIEVLDWTSPLWRWMRLPMPPTPSCGMAVVWRGRSRGRGGGGGSRERGRGTDRTRGGGRDLGRGHAVPVGDSRRDDAAGRPDSADSSPARRPARWPWLSSRRALAGSGRVRDRGRGFPVQEAARIEAEALARHLEAGSGLERVVFAVRAPPRGRRSRPRWPLPTCHPPPTRRRSSGPRSRAAAPRR